MLFNFFFPFNSFLLLKLCIIVNGLNPVVRTTETLYLGWYFVMKKLLESIAQTTGGMYVMVHNMDELSTFFRRQVLLSRFIAQTAHGEWRNEYFCDNCQDMPLCTVRVANGRYILRKSWKSIRKLLIPSWNPFLGILPDEYRVHTISLQSRSLIQAPKGFAHHKGKDRAIKMQSTL